MKFLQVKLKDFDLQVLVFEDLFSYNNKYFLRNLTSFLLLLITNLSIIKNLFIGYIKTLKYFDIFQ